MLIKLAIACLYGGVIGLMFSRINIKLMASTMTLMQQRITFFIIVLLIAGIGSIIIRKAMNFIDRTWPPEN